ncbi:Golgi apparatus membrane protein TVP23-like B [Holothuria leucospilota]|uniref:Golgi apparatus membrane protein TVP23 homolog n=1 Tax=Holothuria leucospilota TaxID=206669 RepID=A0A9Q1H927_HOLLE|nr:Golgi apparatus membrane protein TVP23-like B [Holothuria leucospilota]
MASLDNAEDIALDFGAEDEWRKQRSVRYPLAAVFHLLFKIFALFFFILFNFQPFLGFISTFVLVVLLLALDFWTVKNITGRLLVGLRWWNHVDEDGSSHWVFESRKAGSKTQETSTESRIFWLGLVIPPILWFILVFSTMFNPTWLLIPILGLSLSFSNLYGYLRCKAGAKQQLSSFATQFLGQQLMMKASNDMFSQAQ